MYFRRVWWSVNRNVVEKTATKYVLAYTKYVLGHPGVCLLFRKGRKPVLPPRPPSAAPPAGPAAAAPATAAPAQKTPTNAPTPPRTAEPELYCLLFTFIHSFRKPVMGIDSSCTQRPKTAIEFYFDRHRTIILLSFLFKNANCYPARRRHCMRHGVTTPCAQYDGWHRCFLRLH